MPKKKLRHKLPKHIFVVEREEGGVKFLIADESFSDFEDGEIVGTYRLLSVAKKRIEHSIVE